MDDKRQLTVYLTRDANKILHEFGDENGVTLTALMEVFANHVDKIMTDDRVSEARRVDAHRRRRT